MAEWIKEKHAMKWIKEEPTHELRWLKSHVKIGWLNERNNFLLQQKWKITRGGTGSVEYSEEWRDVPAVEEKQ